MKILLCLLAGLLLSPMALAADTQASDQTDPTVLQLDRQRLAVIARFASLAKAKNANGMLALFVPAARAAIGDAAITEDFKERVMPFFASYQMLHSERTIEPREMPDGQVGYRYYTYIINAAGEKVPFDAIVMESEGSSYIANFIARGCIKGKHPVCP